VGEGANRTRTSGLPVVSVMSVVAFTLGLND
jgi:hypothetical protein